MKYVPVCMICGQPSEKTERLDHEIVHNNCFYPLNLIICECGSLLAIEERLDSAHAIVFVPTPCLAGEDDA